MRFLSIVGPAVVLYVALSVVVERSLSFGEGLGVMLAVALSATPIWVRLRAASVDGGGRVGLLGVALGVWLTSQIGSSLIHQYLRIASVLLSGFLVLDLACAALPRTLMLRLTQFAFAVTATVCLLLAWLGLAPPLQVGGEPWLVPTARWAPLPDIFFVLALGTALGARLWDVRRPKRIVTMHTWPVAGLALTLVAVVLDKLVGASALWVSSLAALLLLCGHVWFATRGGQFAAGGLPHRLLSFFGTAALLLGLVYLLPASVTLGGVGIALLCVGGFVVGSALYRVLYALLERGFVPDGGRLFRAIEEARQTLLGCVTTSEVAEGVLAPFRTSQASPMLIVLDPLCGMTLDAGAKARVRERSIPAPIVEAVRFPENPVIELVELESQMVRRPNVRPLVEAMRREEARWLVPCIYDGVPEGALLIPQAERQRLLIATEVEAFGVLGARVAAMLRLICGQERAERRYGDSRNEQRMFHNQVETLETDLTRLRDQYDALVAGRASQDEAELHVTYSSAMQSALGRAKEVAAIDAPLTVIASAGTPVMPLLRLIHALGPRATRPFIVAECASIAPDASLRLLVGSADRAELGWLTMAEGGTLVLQDFPALSLEAQRNLSDLVETGLDTRIIATSRVPVETLAEVGGVDSELARWLAPLCLTVPRLRQRKEDLPSLTLFAVHRACRVLGRPEMGIEPAAMERILSYAWPGDVAELLTTIEQAVTRSDGSSQIQPSALVGLGARQAPDAALSGTYLAVECRLLEHALARAGGNKSEAARSLGLKRTTFLDKLRRHGLDKAPSLRAVPAPSR